MLTSVGKKEHLFKRTVPSGCFLQENICVRVSFYFRILHWKIFKSTHFKEHL